MGLEQIRNDVVMKLFADPHFGPDRRPTGWTPPATAVFALCLVLGLGMVGWHWQWRVKTERQRAEAEAASRGALLEQQFSRAASAAEVLAVMVRQGRGTMPDFQKVAGELHAAFPELATLELQPGGVVRDIVPRAGNERALGFNVLKDRAYGAGAAAAVERGTTTVTGPVILYGGESGVIVRVPVFQGRGGERQFWGFVAVSMRLTEALRRAGFDEVGKRYDYLLLLEAPATAKPVVLARRGIETPEGAVLQAIQVENLGLRLGLRRQGGWGGKTRALIEATVVLVLSSLLYWVVEATRRRRELEAELDQAKRERADEKPARDQAQREATAGAATLKELAELRAALEKTQAEIMSRDQALIEAGENQQVMQAARNELEQKFQESEARLSAAVQSHGDELRNLQVELEDTRTRLLAAEKKAWELEGAVRRTQSDGKSYKAKVEAEQEKARAAIADLQAQLEAQNLAAQKAAMAAAARVEEAESANRELRGKLAAAEQDQARMAELLVRPETPLEMKADPAGGAVEATAGAETSPPEDEGSAAPAQPQPAAPAGRKRNRRSDHGQTDLFEMNAPAIAEKTNTGAIEAPVASESEQEEKAEIESGQDDEQGEKPEPRSREAKAEAERRSPSSTAVDVAQLRQATNEIFPLLADKDPGAKDCFKAHRLMFRSVFSSAAFEEFEKAVKSGSFHAALECLRKTVKKNGIQI
jgi:hypothetical protein